MHFPGDYAVVNYCSIQCLSMLVNISLQATCLLGLGYAVVALLKLSQETKHFILLISLFGFWMIPLCFYSQTHLIGMTTPMSVYENNGNLALTPSTQSVLQFPLNASSQSFSSPVSPY